MLFHPGKDHPSSSARLGQDLLHMIGSVNEKCCMFLGSDGSCDAVSVTRPCLSSSSLSSPSRQAEALKVDMTGR